MSECCSRHDERADELLAAFREALDIIESVNGCHGCLDNGEQTQRDAVARLRALAGMAEVPA